MDWGKTKNIFIISFLLLNLILGYQLYIKYNSYNQIWTLDSNEELKRILTKNSIVLNIDMPKETPEINFLRVSNNLLSNNNSINHTNDLNINRDKLGLILDEKINNFNEYEYSIVESNNKNLFVYYQVNNGYLFFDAKMIVEIDQNGDIRYRQNYFEVINLGMGKQVISSTSALKIAIEQQIIPPYSKIDNMELGYRGQANQTAIQDLIPVWGIVYKINNDDYITYINAITGEYELDY